MRVINVHAPVSVAIKANGKVRRFLTWPGRSTAGYVPLLAAASCHSASLAPNGAT
jgi:hypothetical protein